QLSTLSSQKTGRHIWNYRIRNYWINSKSPPSCCARGWNEIRNASRCNRRQASRVEPHGRDKHNTFNELSSRPLSGAEGEGSAVRRKCRLPRFARDDKSLKD